MPLRPTHRSTVEHFENFIKAHLFHRGYFAWQMPQPAVSRLSLNKSSNLQSDMKMEQRLVGTPLSLSGFDRGETRDSGKASGVREH